MKNKNLNVTNKHFHLKTKSEMTETINAVKDLRRRVHRLLILQTVQPHLRTCRDFFGSKFIFESGHHS